MKKYKSSIVSIFLLSPVATSQDSIEGALRDLDPMYYLVGILAIFLIVLLIAIYKVVMNLIEQMRYNLYRDQGRLDEYLELQKSSATSWDKITDSWTKAVPIEEEESIDMHHDYDGIRELDNQLPPWWVAMFYGTIAFAIFYVLYYSVGSGLSSQEEYIAEVEQAEIEKAAFLAKSASMVDENSVIMLEDAALLAEGKKIFVSNCAACHLEHGGGNEGSVGPNLTDEYWLHGGDIKSVFSTIKYGVPTKGMISWQAQIKPYDMQKVASYILSLQGSNPAGAKAPQGDKYIPPAVEQTDSLSTL